MPLSAIEKYMERLEKHQALLRLMLGDAAKFPHLDDDDRHEWLRDIELKLNDGVKPVKVAPPAMLKMIGIGVRTKHG
jgi:hypothetical protein